MNRQATMPSASEIDRAAGRASVSHADGKQQQFVNRFLCWLSGIYAVSVLNSCHFFVIYGGRLQTVSESLNHCLFVTAFLLPVVILLTYFNTSAIHRWWATTGLLLLTFPSTVMALACVIMPRPELLRAIPGSYTSIRSFRVSGFDYYSIDIEQQWVVLPGVVWSVPVHYESGAENVTAKILDRHHLQCVFTKDRHVIDEGEPKKYTVTVPIF